MGITARGGDAFQIRGLVSGLGICQIRRHISHPTSHPRNHARHVRPSTLVARWIIAWGGTTMWNQIYNPLNNAGLSTIAAAVPVVTLLVLIASGKVKAHIAAIVAVILTNLIAIFVFTMPAGMSIRASLLGVVAGFFPIGWIVLNVIFLYQLTVATGQFELLKRAVGGVTEDRRLQLLLIAFSFGAFFEGASGFGTPVAITGSVLI